MTKPVSEPLYLQVKRLLLQQITAHKWKANEQLPNEFELANSFNVSQGTMRKALSALTDEGFLTRAQGKGTFVSDLSLEKALLLFFRVATNNSPSGDSQTYAHLQNTSIVEADEFLIETFQAKPKTKFVYMERSRVINDSPAVFEKIYLPVDIFKRMHPRDVDLSSHNLYQMYQTKHSVFIEKVHEKIYPVVASDELKKLLPRSDLLLKIIRTATNQEGIPVEYRIYWVDSNHAHYYANLSRF